MPRSPAQSGEPSPFESQLRRAIPSLQVIIENPKLSSSARLLYALIAARTNHFGYAEIHSGDVADRLGLRRTTVSALMKELRDANAIETRQQGGGRPLLVKLKEPDSRDFRYCADNTVPASFGEIKQLDAASAFFEPIASPQESVIPSPQTPHPGRQSSPRLGGLDLSRSAAAASNGARAREDAVLLLLLNGLKSYGIDEATARDLLASHDVDAIRDQLRSMPHHLADHARRGTAIQKPGAYLRRAIVERFAPHRKAVAEQRAETLAAISTRAIAAELEERATAEMLAMLPAELREDLERRAQAELERNPVVRRAGDEVRRRFIEGCVARLAREAQMGAAS